MKNLVVDCEVVNNPEIYGWHNHKQLGISVAVVWDLDTNEWYIYSAEPHIKGTLYLKDLPKLLDGANIVGHNVEKFDIPLIKAVAGDFEVGKVSDTWKALYEATGDMIALQYIVTQLGIGSKTMNGVLAAVNWQKGLHKEVIDYCKNDVWLEGTLYKKIMSEGVVFKHPDKNLLLGMYGEHGNIKVDVMTM